MCASLKAGTFRAAAAGLAAAFLICGGTAFAQQPALKPSVGEGSAGAAKPAQKPSPAPSKSAKAEPAAQPPGNAGAAKTKRKGSQAIVALVGDDPITAYEIEQRQMLLSQGAGIGQQAQTRFQSLIKSQATQDRMKEIQREVVEGNPGKSREELIAIIKSRMQTYAKSLQKQAVDGARAGAMSGLKQKALDALIDERLMIQEAKRVGVLVSDEEVEKALVERAKRSNMTKEQYAAQFKNLGVDMETMRSTYKAQMSWMDVIRRRFGHQVQVTEREVDRVVSKKSDDIDDDVELQLQRITLTMPDKLDQKIMAKRFQEAESIWRKFDSCKSLPALTSGVAGARLESLGNQRPGSIPEPTRGLLVSAAENTMLPPSVGQGGMELWVVCGRSVVKATEKKREVAESELRKEQFNLLADRHLKDLRKDTPIEYR